MLIYVSVYIYIYIYIYISCRGTNSIFIEEIACLIEVNQKLSEETDVIVT